MLISKILVIDEESTACVLNIFDNTTKGSFHGYVSTKHLPQRWLAEKKIFPSHVVVWCEKQ